ncbi:hypothetical protein [Butyrivibrio sp. NC3005]|uniref:hypothetical protein n=1 Tax=Butyrivibrio sp. NC3005 TaxID=1280685 RepID=UPI000423470E|nr:hypothetical protein [Butyrivibrio sp. NC3005]
MPKNKKEDLLISDSGVKEDLNQRRVTAFVIICRILTIVLIILGVIAFLEGNFCLLS